MNNGIDIMVIGWHTEDLQEEVELLEGSIIMPIVSFWFTLLQATIS